MFSFLGSIYWQSTLNTQNRNLANAVFNLEHKILFHLNLTDLSILGGGCQKINTWGQPGSICQVKFVFELQVLQAEFNTNSSTANDKVIDWLENQFEISTLAFLLLCNHSWKKEKRKKQDISIMYTFLSIWNTEHLRSLPWALFYYSSK